MDDAAREGIAKLETLASAAKVLILLVAVSSFLCAIGIALLINDAWPENEFYLYEMTSFDWLIMIDVLLLLVSAVAVACWIYRAHANLQAAGTPGSQMTPGMAVVWYFIPIANWFKPYQSMRELWQGSVEQDIDAAQTAPGLIWLWWLCWVASGLTSFSNDYNSFDVLPYIASVVSAGALYVIVDRITQAQPAMSVASTFE